MNKCLLGLLSYEDKPLSEEQLEVLSDYDYMVFSVFGRNPYPTTTVGPTESLIGAALKYAAPKYEYIQLLDCSSTPLKGCIDSNLEYLKRWNEKTDNSPSKMVYSDYFIRHNNFLGRIYCPSFSYKNYIKKLNDIDNLFIKIDPTLRLTKSSNSLLEFALLNSNNVILHNPKPLYYRPYKDTPDTSQIRLKYAKLYL